MRAMLAYANEHETRDAGTQERAYWKDIAYRSYSSCNESLTILLNIAKGKFNSTSYLTSPNDQTIYTTWPVGIT